MRFGDILVLFKLDLGQITFNPVENAFASQQLVLPPASRFTIVTWAYAEIENLGIFGRESDLRF